MNLLMTIAVLGAIAIGEWFEAATVTFLFALSHALESWSVGRARRADAALMDLSPPTARLLKADGSTEDVPVAAVPVGATFLVPAGQRIPLDGRVLRGSSHVNEAPITGESLPVEKNPLRRDRQRRRRPRGGLHQGVFGDDARPRLLLPP